MPWANVGDWIYFRGGRDYIIKWDHKKSGQTIELEPSEENDALPEWGKMEWEVQWSNDKGDVDYLGTWPERMAFTVAGRLMERYPNGIPKALDKSGGLMLVADEIAKGIQRDLQQKRVARKLEVRRQKTGRIPRLSR